MSPRFFEPPKDRPSVDLSPLGDHGACYVAFDDFGELRARVDVAFLSVVDLAGDYFLRRDGRWEWSASFEVADRDPVRAEGPRFVESEALARQSATSWLRDRVVAWADR